MNEARFRTLMRDAVGDESMRPWLTEAVRTRFAQPQPRSRSARWMALAAACLAAVVVAVAVAPRLLNRSTPSPVVPAASASPTPPSAAAFTCTLPGLVGDGQRGYVDTSTGAFTSDSTKLPVLPSDGSGLSFDAAFHAWLPVTPSQVAPDGRAYVYEGQYPDYLSGLPLWVYALDTRVNRYLGSYRGRQPPIRWAADGIHLNLTDTPGEVVIDPATGKARGAPSSHFLFEPLPGDPHGTDGTSFHPIGVTAAGQTIWWFFNLDQPKEVDWVFYETSPGVRVYIYRGTMGDATSFSPGAALADQLGIWFSDYEQRRWIWHWDGVTGLRKISVTGLQTVRQVIPAGPCF